jgi:dUTPase
MKFQRIHKISKTNDQKIIHLSVKNNHNFFANDLCVHNCNYRGELGVILQNSSKSPMVINHGDKIAQLVLCPVLKCVWDEEGELDDTTRGEGGYGSTEKKGV